MSDHCPVCMHCPSFHHVGPKDSITSYVTGPACDQPKESK